MHFSTVHSINLNDHRQMQLKFCLNTLGCKIDVTFNNFIIIEVELLTSSCKNLLLRIKLN